MLVPLQVGFQVVFCEAFVDLRQFSILKQQRMNVLAYFREWIFIIGLLVSELKR